jgi:hypothetical protein
MREQREQVSHHRETLREALPIDKTAKCIHSTRELTSVINNRFFRNLLVFFIGPNAVRTLPARLFAWAGRVRCAWRPAATRTGVLHAMLSK